MNVVDRLCRWLSRSVTADLTPEEEREDRERRLLLLEWRLAVQDRRKLRDEAWQREGEWHGD